MRPVYILEFYAHLFRYVTPNIILCIVRVITYTANTGTLDVFFKHDSNIYSCVARENAPKDELWLAANLFYNKQQILNDSSETTTPPAARAAMVAANKRSR